jgi:predicted transport protein
MSTLAAAVDQVLAVAAANERLPEAETKAVLIEPILDALGWDTRDLASVRREVPVAGGTNVDYGLLDSDGDVRLHVEAKALRTKLGIKVVTQTVNYANGAGVPWAVLTDGLRWHVLWSNAPVANDRKEVFAVDLTDLAGPDTTEADRAATLAQLGLLARSRVEAGDLDATGAALFDVAAVRGVLDNLFTRPPDELVALVTSRLRRPPDPDRVRAALVSLGRPFTGSTPAPLTTAPPPVKKPGSRKQGPRQPHTYEEHFGNASQAVVDLYQRFHEAVMARDPRMGVEFKSKAVNYALGPAKRDIVVTVVPQASRLKIFVVLPGDRADLDPELRNMRPDGPDTRGIGHHGHGDVMAPLTTTAEIEDRLALVDEAIAAHDAQ